MIPKIVAPSKHLMEFLWALNLKLTKPQFRHLMEVVDSLIVCEAPKTLTELNRQLVEKRDHFALADFFTYSPWNDKDVQSRLKKFLIDSSLKDNSLGSKAILISIDDSMTRKPVESKHFEPVDFHFDHTKGGPSFGLSFLTLHIEIGKQSYILDLRPYLRAKTVRKINRRRPQEKRLKFKSKFSLAKEMLAELKPLIPKDLQIYVLFDSWYASAKLIKFLRRQGWHVICKIKHNRKLNGKKVSSYAKRSPNKSLTRVVLGSVTYLTFSFKGYINNFGEEVSVILSKRHHRDRSPEYFLSTDVSLKTKEVLNYYERRWQSEIDHLYLKTRLGLGDFRLRKAEGITKYLALVLLALAYLQYRLARDDQLKNISGTIFKHRQEHLQLFLKEVCKMTLEKGSAESVLERFMPKAA